MQQKISIQVNKNENFLLRYFINNYNFNSKPMKAAIRKAYEPRLDANQICQGALSNWSGILNAVLTISSRQNRNL